MGTSVAEALATAALFGLGIKATDLYDEYTKEPPKPFSQRTGRRTAALGVKRQRRKRKRTPTRKGGTKYTRTSKRTGQGAGLRRGKRITQKRTTPAKKRKTFAKRVRAVMAKDTEKPGMMFHMKLKPPANVSDNRSYEILPYKFEDTYGVVGQNTLYAPPGLSIDHGWVDAATRRHIDYRCGNTLFPFNCTVKQTGWNDGDLPNGTGANTSDYFPRYEGREFVMNYLAVDFGWMEGQDFREQHTDTEVEVVFGMLNNYELLEDWIADDPTVRGIEAVINSVLGPKGNRDWSTVTGSLPKRSFSKHARTQDEEEKDFHRHKPLFHKHIKILKRVIYHHRPVVKDAPTALGGHADVHEKEIGRLWGQGSYKFPIEGKKLQLLDKYGSDAGAGGEDLAIDYSDIGQEFMSRPYHKTGIPFVHIRGCAMPGSELRTAGYGDFTPNFGIAPGQDTLYPTATSSRGIDADDTANPQYFDEGRDALKCYLRWKLKITDP